MSMRLQIRRARAGTWYLLTAAACVLMVTACGSTAAPGSAAASGGSGASPTSGSPSASPQPAKVTLEITVDHGPGTPMSHWSLRCEPAGGTDPDPARACRVLLRVKEPFGPLPKGIMCPMILAGTKVATVTGTWFGKPVSVTMDEGGCWMSRWAEIGQIFN
jgi:hypothetical protein